MKNNRFFKLSSRQIVACPFTEDEFGVVSPRCYKDFSSASNCDGGYFSSSIQNSFPDLGERVRFLNKFYQCLLCNQLCHKARKLVAIGAKDSGKSSWVNVLFSIIPKSKVAILTKEQHFGASMIQDDTQLLFVDEWAEKMMSSDLVKTLLQGGYFAQSVKHQNPRMQEMNGGVYITCNKLPNFDVEQENVERRLAIYHTRTMSHSDKRAPAWMRNNAMNCIIWMANVINCNTDLLEQEERFYELPYNVKANARTKNRMDITDIQKIQNFEFNSVIITESPYVNEGTLHKHYGQVANCIEEKGKKVRNNTFI